MKILLDSHMIGKKETGNERYWKNLSETFTKLHQYKKQILFFKYVPHIKNGLFRIFFGFDLATKSLKPDIIHVQNFAPFFKKTLVINTVHDLCFQTYPNFFSLKSNFAYNFFLKRSLSISDAIICPSEQTKKHLLSVYKIDRKKVHVIYDAADTCFRFLKNKNEVRASLLKRFNISNRYFLVVGNIENRKQPQLIINCFEKIVKIFPDIKLVFVGPNKLGFIPNKDVMIIGYVSDKELNLLYNGAISLIYLSLCEGFGLPIVEAMATMTPVICNNLSVFREITKGSALIVNNQNGLTSAMINIVDNDHLRKELGHLSYKRSKFFSWNKTAQETIKIYRKVLINTETVIQT